MCGMKQEAQGCLTCCWQPPPVAIFLGTGLVFICICEHSSPPHHEYHDRGWFGDEGPTRLPYSTRTEARDDKAPVRQVAEITERPRHLRDIPAIAAIQIGYEGVGEPVQQDGRRQISITDENEAIRPF